MNKIKIKVIISIFVLTIIIYVVLISLIINGSKIINSETNKYESYIGKKLILNDDTLIVIDYSLFNEHLILDNGIKINIKLAEELKEVE